MGNSLWYPSVEDVLALHDDIVSEYPDTHSGVANRGDIEFALSYIKEGNFNTVPETIHAKAFHLLRLLVANHPFVDANKRTHSTRQSCSTSSTVTGSSTMSESRRS